MSTPRTRPTWPLIAFLMLGALSCGDESPYFQSVLAPTDTTDTLGPYGIEAYVVAPRGVDRLLIRFNTGSAHSGSLPMLPVEEGGASGTARLWWGELPGRPAGSAYAFHLVLVDMSGVKAHYPEGAPEVQMSFAIAAD